MAILITGSTDGIGKETARQLAQRGYHVILHGRDPEKCRTARREIFGSTGNLHVDGVCCDLSNRQHVHELADEIGKKYGRLDVLIHNAGTYEKKYHPTADGLEKTFAVNHLAPFLLTHLLLDLLKKSAPARIVMVSSSAHRSLQTLDLENLQGEKYYDAYQAYASSKFCNLLFTYTMARRLEHTGVTINALHPGVIDTKLLREGFKMKGDSVEEGARTPVFLASAPEVHGISGKYFEQGQVVRSASGTYDAELQEVLWEMSENLAFHATGRSVR